MTIDQQPFGAGRHSRRGFLKWSAAVVGGAALASLFWKLEQDFTQVIFNGKLYRATRDGKILESTTRGSTWTQTANLGPDFVARQIRTAGNTLQVHFDFHGLPLELHSADARAWYTPGYQPPA